MPDADSFSVILRSGTNWLCDGWIKVKHYTKPSTVINFKKPEDFLEWNSNFCNPVFPGLRDLKVLEQSTCM